MLNIEELTINDDLCEFTTSGTLELMDTTKYFLINSNKKYNITIPNKVDNVEIKALGDNAFRGCNSIINIVLPQGLQRIGVYCFGNCLFKNIKFPENIQRIKKRAFYNCTQLTSIKLPNHIAYIENEAFKNCTNLKRVVVPANISNISKDAFMGCKYLNIFYKDDIEKFKDVMENGFEDVFANDCIKIISVKEFDKYICDIQNIANANQIIEYYSRLNNPAIQEYFSEELENKISMIDDLNKKLQLLTVLDNVKKELELSQESEFDR